MLTIKFLSDNKTERADCFAEWGLSIYIETEERKLLLDAGTSPQVFVHNAREMGVDLSAVEALVISHGHFDHTVGVPKFCRINERAPVYIREEGLIQSYDLPLGTDEEGRPLPGQVPEAIGLPWTASEWKEIEPRLVPVGETVWLTDQIAISGDLPMTKGFEPTEAFYQETAPGSGRYRQDTMRHEQILAIRRPEGIFVFSGCSHTGVEACVLRAMELFPGEKVAMLVAGMHLIAASEGAGRAAAEQLMRLGVERVMPMHCTGMRAICELKAALGERCVLPYAGSVYRFE